MSTRSRAFTEALSDTAIALATNIPIGFAVIAFANWLGIVSVTYEQNVQLVILQNIVFTVVAVIRKTYVRMYFEQKNDRKKAAGKT